MRWHERREVVLPELDLGDVPMTLSAWLVSQGAAVVEALSDIPAVTTLQTVSGLYDLVTQLEAPTTEAMDEVLDQIGAIAGVEKTITSIVLSTKLRR